MNLRDPVLYRIMHAHHHNTGDAWCIYPMYDYAHPLEDALEHITHSLCTLEFENHRPLYDWVIDNCPVPSKPRQIEFARLNLSYTVMSKRKLLQLVQEGHVSGWNDPRLPTISGLRRRGYPPEAVVHFCKRVGITKFNGTTDVALLEFDIRDFLNTSAPRRMAVLDPVKVVLENWSAEPLEHVEVPNHPQDPEMGDRKIPISNEIWIEREDFMEVPEKKFFRLGPDRHVRLKGGHIIHCTGFEKDADGNITLIRAEILPGTVGADSPEGVVCKAAIHWVDVATGVDAEVRHLRPPLHRGRPGFGGWRIPQRDQSGFPQGSNRQDRALPCHRRCRILLPVRADRLFHRRRLRPSTRQQARLQPHRRPQGLLGEKGREVRGVTALALGRVLGNVDFVRQRSGLIWQTRDSLSDQL